MGKFEFYNSESKEEFLNTVEHDEVKSLYISLFEKSRSLESLYRKDLYNFNLEQIGKTMKNINPATQNSVINTKSRMNIYISWAINNGRRINNLNPLLGTTKEWDSQFINNLSQRYLSEMDIYEIINELINPQDQALIQCLFEGIQGRGLSELLSLNYKNIDWDNGLVTVKDDKDNKWRSVPVSRRCLHFIHRAYEQTVYTSEKTDSSANLIECSGKIFKNIDWRSTKIQEATANLLSKRLYILKEKFELPSLASKTINDSGKIKYAVDLWKERGKLTKEEFTLIGDRFNIGKMSSSGYEYYDTTKMKNYINGEIINDLYGLEIEV